MSMKKPHSIGKIFSVLLVLVLVFFVFETGFYAGKNGIDLKQIKINGNSDKPANVDFSLYWEAWNKFNANTIYSSLTDKQKVYGSIAGLLQSSGDPYTVFFSPDDYKKFEQDIGGQFTGIGAELISKNGLTAVVAPLSGSPAEKAGLKANDIISKVDGKTTANMNFNDVVDEIRGQSGTQVKLEIIRAGSDKPIEMTITRQDIVVKSVTWKTISNSGKKYMYVKVSQFGDDTDQLFDQFAAEAVKAKPDGIIVDLRDNPGGYLTTAVNLSSYFVDGGTIVKEQDKNNQTKNYDTTKSALLKGFNTAVLVNGGSASASEIFSGALQDRKAGKLIGEKTFGKGSVQELLPLSDGSAIKVTVAKWLTPNGRQINEKGIEPDIAITPSTDASQDTALNRALDYLNTGK